VPVPRQDHLPGVPGQVPPVERLDPPELGDQHRAGVLGHHGNPVLVALSAANRELTQPQVHVLHPEMQRLQQPEAAAVEERAHQPRRPLELVHDGRHLASIVRGLMCLGVSTARSCGSSRCRVAVLVVLQESLVTGGIVLEARAPA
jgi:hypothetical protein